MEEKKPFTARLESFFAGKGFYIVLLLCVGVIGISVWSMLSGGRSEGEDLAVAVAGIEEGGELSDAAPAAASRPTPAPAPKETTTPKESEVPAEPDAAPEPEAPAIAAPVPEIPAPAPAQESAGYFIWPVTGEIEAGYAMASLIYDSTMRDWRAHDGLDIAAPMGTQVRASANGVVESVYSDERYGTTVVLRHGGGLTSTYANLAATPAVSEGQEVGVGQVLGAVGDTALCEIGEASHLHFSMTKDGLSADPTEYLP